MMLLPTLLLACTTADTGGEDGIDTGDTAVVVDTTPVWTKYPIQTNSSLNGIYASGAGVYVVGSGGFAWYGGPDGFSFMDIDVDGQDLTDLWGQGQNESTILAASTNLGLVAQYTSAGWSTGDLHDTNELKGVGGSGPDALFAVGWGRAYSYDGSTWTYETLPDQNAKLNDVYAEGAEAFAVGEDGTCVHRANGVWETCDTGTTATLEGISGSSASDVWAVGDAGTVVHWNGTKWKVEEVPTTQKLWAVFVPEKGVVYAVGSAGTAVRLKNDEWKILYTGVENNLYAVHGISAKNVWTSGNRGMVLQYKDTE